MSGKVVIDVGRVGDQFFCQLSGKQDGGIPFDIGAASAQNGDDVKTAGAKILAELFKNHEIKKVIERALGVDPRSSQPIYINATAVRAQSVWWEALWSEPPGFLSLDRRWPIARIAGVDKHRVPASFTAPLRILAVISAEDVPGAAEWRALYEAAEQAVAGGLAVELKVVTGEAALYQALNAQQYPNWMSVEPVPDNLTGLDTIIGRFAPHILHFFCHGEVDAGSAWLEILTPLEPLRVPIDKLTATPALEKVWLVVLNSCLGAAALGDAPSMAYKLVCTGEVPFAIGATEPVDARDATIFARAFYQRLLYRFADTVKHAAAHDVLTVEWADALHAARAAIDQAHQHRASERREWAVPILYEHRSTLQVMKVDGQPGGGPPTPQQDADALRLKMAMDLVATLPPDTPDHIKKSLVAAVLGQANGG